MTPFAFDVSLKELTERQGGSSVRLVTGTAAAWEAIGADLATVTSAADKVIRVQAPQPWLLHLEMLSDWRAHMPETLHWYNGLLHHRHELPVRSVLVLLRRRANSPKYDGLYEARLPGEAEPYLQFRYRVIRLWETPVAQLLTSGLGTVPLAPLGDVPETDLPEVVRRMGEKLAAAPPEEVERLWTTAYILTGLRLAPRTWTICIEE